MVLLIDLWTTIQDGTEWDSFEGSGLTVYEPRLFLVYLTTATMMMMRTAETERERRVRVRVRNVCNSTTSHTQ